MVRRMSWAARARVRRVANFARTRAAVRRRMRPIANQAAAVARLMRNRRRPLRAFVPRRPWNTATGSVTAMLRSTGRSSADMRALGRRRALGRVRGGPAGM